MTNDGQVFENIGDSGRLVIEFGSREAALHFKHWLCGAGEQEYWMWMEYREAEEDGDITALRFKYHTGDETIKAEVGRMDADWTSSSEPPPASSAG